MTRMETRRKKVLVVAQTPPPYHGQAVMNEIFLHGEYATLDLVHIRMAFSSTIREVGRFRLGKLASLISLVLRIAWQRTKTGANILYYQPASPNLVPFLRDVVVLVTTRWMFRATVFHFHAAGLAGYYGHLPRIGRWLYRIAYSRPELAICLSEATRSDAEHINASATCVVPNGIEDVAQHFKDRRTQDHSNRPPTILFLGMLSREKGVDDLLQACQILDDRKVFYRLVIAGEAESDSTARRVKDLCGSLQGDVTLAGKVTGDAKRDCYLNADIFCFPTFYRAEGFPVVLLEAMMFSLPVVSTKWRGIPEIVEDGQTGILLEPGHPEHLAGGLQTLLADRHARQVMGTKGRARFVEKFTASQFQRNMECALNRVCAA
ncbi:MAG: glycosyltransferase family 4 protein [Chthoniobacterales bacterium]|nr:glycosyltransferase family 4 protein [Chthoniobacterales bacterium]